MSQKLKDNILIISNIILMLSTLLLAISLIINKLNKEEDSSDVEESSNYILSTDTELSTIIEVEVTSDTDDCISSQTIEEEEELIDLRDITIEFIQSETNLSYESCEVLYDRVGNHEVLSVPIMLGIYWNESGFQPDAVNSSSNATGLAQFMPEYAEWLANLVGVDYRYEYLFDPTYSINLSVDLLEYYLDASNNDLDYALDHYSGFTPGKYPRRIRGLADGYQAKMLEYIELNQ